MDRVIQPLARRWAALDDRGRRHGTVLAGIALLYVLHFLVYTVGSPWYIEDAAITFAYARNFVDGEGFATFAGGERVEGYSNPLWTFLVAFWYAVGIPEWVSSKLMGVVFGIVGLPAAYALARRALGGLAWTPEEGPTGRPTDGLALLGPLFLALSPQYVIWNASGLENSLYVMLLLGGFWRLCIEVDAERDGGRRWPLSAVLLVLVCMTRPEGVMYASAALLGRVLAAGVTRRPLAVVGWLATFLVPFAAYNGWRFWYFGWEFPNTYYAKAGSGVNQFQPWNWNGSAWKQIRNYFEAHHLAYALPLLPIAMTGLRGWRRWVSVVAIAWLGTVLLWDGREGLPDGMPAWWSDVSREWVEIRVWSLLAWGVVLGLANLGRRGWLARSLLWCLFCGGLFFYVYTGYEWMKAWRWFNIIGAGMFPLLAVGLAELLADLPLVDRRIPLPGARLSHLALPAWALLVVPLTGTFAAIEVQQALQFAESPEVATRDIHRRVRYMRDVQHKLDVDHITLLDVDMGAHMYFASDWRIMDMAGLVDVPFARHRRYDRPFVTEYVFEENDPEFAHVHSSWARATKIPSYQQWKEGYLEIPGYPYGRKRLHVGNHVRRNLFITQGQAFPDSPAVDFTGRVRLLHSEVRSPEVSAGGALYVHLVFQTRPRDDGFQALVIFDDGQGHRGVSAVEPGWGWYPPEDWKRSEQVHGRFRVPVPDHLPPGQYDLGLLLLDEATGRVLSPRLVDDEPYEAPALPRYARGEYFLPDVKVAVVSREEAEAAALADIERGLSLAAMGEDCDQAWQAWKDGTRHLLADLDWRAAREDEGRAAIAACHVARARRADDRAERVAELRLAMKWDHRLDGLTGETRPLAAELVAEGDTAFAAEDWEAAYDRYDDALALDPRLSHVRRRAEEARDYKLDIREPGESYPPEKKKRGGS